MTPEEIAEWKAKAIEWPPYEGFFGNVYHRPIYLQEPGESHPGHDHNHDHITILSPGFWLVRARKPDGECIERSFVVPANGYCVLHIEASTWHEITSLDGNGSFGCVYATRDETGEIASSGVYTEAMTPYV